MCLCFFCRFLSTFYPTKSIFFQHFRNRHLFFFVVVVVFLLLSFFCTLIAASAWSTCQCNAFVCLCISILQSILLAFNVSTIRSCWRCVLHADHLIFSTMNQKRKTLIISIREKKISFSHLLLLLFLISIFAHLHIRARYKCRCLVDRIFPSLSVSSWLFHREYGKSTALKLPFLAQQFPTKMGIQTSCWTVSSGLKHNIRIFERQTDLELIRMYTVHCLIIKQDNCFH